jgi:hypothetical protein
MLDVLLDYPWNLLMEKKIAPRPEPVGAIVAEVCRRIWLGRTEPNTVGGAQTQGAALEK